MVFYFIFLLNCFSLSPFWFEIFENLYKNLQELYIEHLYTFLWNSDLFYNVYCTILYKLLLADPFEDWLWYNNLLSLDTSAVFPKKKSILLYYHNAIITQEI